jgi:hypothetical protein
MILNAGRGATGFPPAGDRGDRIDLTVSTAAVIKARDEF